jgi:hypothetical protein
MLARVAEFDGQPDRFTTAHRYGYVLEAIARIPGFRGGLHLADPTGDRSISISLWEDETSMNAGQSAVETARNALGLVAPHQPRSQR